MTERTYYPTIILSDIHLGSEYSRTEEVSAFLKQVDCGRLILNGDIIDGWQLRKVGKRWKQKHSDFFRVLMKMMENQGTEIIYVRGNHDDFLDSLVPLYFYNISIVKEYILETHGRRYLVTHGDIFDSISSHMKWLAVLGDAGYSMLLWMNKLYNYYRKSRGKTYFSLARYAKHKVKSAVSYISSFQQELVKLARLRKVNGIICGHIHQVANVWYDDIHYLNSGDWVESMTALVEDEDGLWDIVYYQKSKTEESPQEVIVDEKESIPVVQAV